MCVCLYVCMHVHVCMCIRVQIADEPVCMCACVRVCVCVCVCVHTYAHNYVDSRYLNCARCTAFNNVCLCRGELCACVGSLDSPGVADGVELM